MKKTVITVTGIRPDFIRMSEIFKKFDEEYNHILIHSGQHYDKLLSDVFFDELNIRKPDYNLEVGGPGKEHFHQTSDLSVKLIELIRKENLNPDLICFLGDSNSVVCAVDLKKEGYKIAHIEAGMRSGDKRMLEEINRTVCDHCSDYLFVYHQNYKTKVARENIDISNTFVVGNTIVEVATPIVEELKQNPPANDFILMDIHRPENFKYQNRLENILNYARRASLIHKIPVKMLSFGRTMKAIEKYGLDLSGIEVVPLMSYKEFMATQYNAKFMISDSGTAQEEPALVNTPVIVPRSYTERPESVAHNCSFMIEVDHSQIGSQALSFKWLDEIFNGTKEIDPSWLGNGNTADLIIKNLKKKL